MPVTILKFNAFLRQLTIGSKTLITFIATGTSLMQIQQARDFVILHTVSHPRLASITAGVFGILVVLHNPQVQKFLHIEQVTVTDPTGASTTDTNVTTGTK